MGRLALAVAAAVPAGVLLGLGAQGIDHVHPGFKWLGALGVPWLLLAFAMGALVQHVAPRGVGLTRRAVVVAAATAGALTLTVATGGWYALTVSQGSLRYGVLAAAGWMPVAALSGALFALAGAAWRHGGRFATPAGAAVVAGALIGEVLVLRQEWPSRAAHAVLMLELAAGLVLPFALARRAILPALALAALAAIAFGAAEEEVRSTLRAAGWKGL